MPKPRTDGQGIKNSRKLRQNMTDAERRLLSALRNHQLDDVHFRRQHAIGSYIVDFCAPRHKLIIEVDGGQHIEQAVYDAQRTTFFEQQGYRVLRFWNHEVVGDLETVLEAILVAVKENTIPV